MSFLSTFSQEEFNTQQEQWEKLLRAELKLDEVGKKLFKTSSDGKFPILSLSASQEVQLSVKESWKKASQTYINFKNCNLVQMLEEDLEAGVRNFFFHKEFLNLELGQIIISTLEKFERSEELEVFLLGQKDFTLSSVSLKIIDENNMAIGRTAHDLGGNNIQELGLLGFCIIDKLERPQNTLHVGVFTDSHFFRNIAKIRAARLITSKILNESGSTKEFAVVGLTSYREWTLYERYSNMLRNDVSVGSAYIGGADHVQSSGYQNVFEIESLDSTEEHGERSRRMARNTSHILALESMLGTVEDAAFGSFHLESLTEQYAQAGWTYMQKLLSSSPMKPLLLEEVRLVREERLKNFKTRKHVLAGMNDFPDVKESLNLAGHPESNFFRLSQSFEELRLKMEKVIHKPEVYIALFGDYAALNGRVNFVKNYFELLGLTVFDPHHSQFDLHAYKAALLSNQKEIVVVLAQDADYPQLEELTSLISVKDRFIAGKFEMPGFVNLFAGQNVFEILETIVSRWGSK